MTARILCLHGFRQNALMMNKATGALRKQLKSKAEFIYINATHILDDENNLIGLSSAYSPQNTQQSAESINDENQESSTKVDPEETVARLPRAWWKANATGETYHGWSETLAYIRKIFTEQGPFDGLLCFSQGAILGAVLCGIQQHNLYPEISFSFAVLISGYPSRDTGHQSFLHSSSNGNGNDSGISVPSLHVIGSRDELVTPERSQKLIPLFKDPQVYEHDGGHLIPLDSTSRGIITQFILKHSNKSSAAL